MPTASILRNTVGVACVASLALALAARAQPSLLIVADICPPEADMEATGLFSAVDTFNSALGTPTLIQLQGYDAVFAFSDDAPMEPIALGNVLADFSDLGGCTTLASYAFSGKWSFAGRIMNTGYSPFLFTPEGDLALPGGNFVATQPNDPIFDGVDLGKLDYQFNDNMADGTLDTGAFQLATDGKGLNLVARAALRPIFGFNVFPAGEAAIDCGDNDAEIFRAIANSLANCRGIFADGFEGGDHCRWSTATTLCA